MDDACYDSVDNVIVAVRGGRAYKCNPTTGAILLQTGTIALPDFSQLANGPATCCWDPVTAKVFCAAWNVGHYNKATETSVRSFWKIEPVSLAISNTYDFNTVFSGGTGIPSNQSALENGIAVMRAYNTKIYGVGWGVSAFNPAFSIFRFNPGSPTTSEFVQSGYQEYPSFCYGVVGGTNDVVFYNMQDANRIGWYDFTAASFGSNAIDGTKEKLAIEYAVTQNRLFCTDEFQLIYVYDNAGTYITTIDTGDSSFNGVNIAQNPYTEKIYVAGGASNSVAVINPATNALTMKTGFDLPWRFVFTPTKTFCVQQGAIGLKEVV